jgi:hypothetical protein
VGGAGTQLHPAPAAEPHGIGAVQATKIDPDMPNDTLTVDYMLENIWIVGDPERSAPSTSAGCTRRWAASGTCWPSPRTRTTPSGSTSVCNC